MAFVEEAAYRVGYAIGWIWGAIEAIGMVLYAFGWAIKEEIVKKFRK